MYPNKSSIRQTVEDGEYGAEAGEVVACEVGNGCDAVGRVVLCAVAAGATEAFTHRRVMYDVDAGEVNAPGFAY